VRAKKKHVGRDVDYITLLLFGMGCTEDETSEAAAAVCRYKLAERTGQWAFAAAESGLVGPSARVAAIDAGEDMARLEAALADAEYRLRAEGSLLGWVHSASDAALERGMRELLDTPGISAQEKLRRIADLENYETPSALITAAEGLDRLQKQLVSLENRAGTIPTPGFAFLRSAIGTYTEGDLTVVAARTNVGKSMFALNEAVHVARSGHCCAYFSMEMPNERVSGRAGSVVSGIRAPERRDSPVFVSNDLTLHRLLICDTPAQSTGAIAAAIGGMERTRRPRVVVVDYLGLMDHGEILKNSTEASAIGRTVKQLRSAGRSLGFHLILLAQVNRAGAEEGKVELHHLRGSGDIEQDADCIVVLNKRSDGKIEANVRKNRVSDSFAGSVLGFVGDSCRMAEE
jgi:replicative DNA helicase